VKQRVVEFMVEDVVTVLHDPRYGYGRALEPQAEAVSFFVELNKELAEQWGRSDQVPTLAELDTIVSAALDWLVEQGICHRAADVAPIVSKDVWLQAQQSEIRRIAYGLTA